MANNKEEYKLCDCNDAGCPSCDADGSRTAEMKKVLKYATIEVVQKELEGLGKVEKSLNGKINDIWANKGNKDEDWQEEERLSDELDKVVAKINKANERLKILRGKVPTITTAKGEEQIRLGGALIGRRLTGLSIGPNVMFDSAIEVAKFAECLQKEVLNAWAQK